MLQAIIEEARHHSSKVYYCFVDFSKAFNFVPKVTLFQMLQDIGIFEALMTTIMRLYQCYRNRTGPGKTGWSDRFTGLAGPVSNFFWKNRIFFQTGYGTGRNRPEPAEPVKNRLNQPV